MLSERARSIIDRIVDESIPYSWLKMDDESGEDLDDLACVEPTRLLGSGHLHKIVDDAKAILNRLYPGSRPVNVRDFNKRCLTSSIQADNVIYTFDQVVNYVMVWSKKKGYDTYKEPVNFHYTPGDDLHFCYQVIDASFYLAASEWVAKEFVKRKIITPSSVAQLMSRAKERV